MIDLTKFHKPCGVSRVLLVVNAAALLIALCLAHHLAPQLIAARKRTELCDKATHNAPICEIPAALMYAAFAVLAECALCCVCGVWAVARRSVPGVRTYAAFMAVNVTAATAALGYIHHKHLPRGMVPCKVLHGLALHAVACAALFLLAAWLSRKWKGEEKQATTTTTSVGKKVAVAPVDEERQHLKSSMMAV